MNKEKKVLLHICCGVCAFSCIERLEREGYTVEGFYFNPNIHPRAEYDKRKAVLKAVKEATGIIIHDGEYAPDDWFALCQGHAHEAEGGIRCSTCFRMRLLRTKQVADKLKIDCFTTTLTVSPHKKSSVVFAAGEQVDKDMFLKIDFKKKDGFKRTQKLAKQHGVYHQQYCGCIYSLQHK